VPPGTQILVGGVPTRAQLASPQLTSLIIPWTGLPRRTSDLLRDFPQIRAHNLHHNAPIVAEMTIALLLAAAKRVVPFDQALRQGDWSRAETDRTLLLRGKTCLILGYGAIGQRVAPICRALGMTVIATRRHAQDSDGIAHEIHPAAALPGLLPRAHALLVCLPLTEQTRGMIGPEELGLLPDTALVVNVGRGSIIDEEALYLALRDRRIGGAGLDVWYNYPTDDQYREATQPSHYPFGDLDNVVMSPHRGGAVVETEQLRAQGLAEMLNIAANGEPLPNRVDLERGY
jgi:phosphoglycerate dehydrogenase-like enzyme